MGCQIRIYRSVCGTSSWDIVGQGFTPADAPIVGTGLPDGPFVAVIVTPLRLLSVVSFVAVSSGACRRRYFLVPPRKYPKNAAGEAVECLAPARQATSPDPTRRALSLLRLSPSATNERNRPCDGAVLLIKSELSDFYYLVFSQQNDKSEFAGIERAPVPDCCGTGALPRERKEEDNEKRSSVYSLFNPSQSRPGHPGRSASGRSGTPVW